MNIFRLKEWWRYRGAAKGRHGVHSPFVYSFIETGLKATVSSTVRKRLCAVSGSTHYRRRQAITIWRCLTFLKVKSVEWMGPDELQPLVNALSDSANVTLCRHYHGNIISPTPDCFLLASGPEDAEAVFNDTVSFLPDGLFFIITDIHDSPEMAALWQRLCTDARVNLSIDLWYVGLLFYRGDFKERQHFVLKHRA